MDELYIFLVVMLDATVQSVILCKGYLYTQKSLFCNSNVTPQNKWCCFSLQ